MKLPLWADGMVFGALLVPVNLFLKIICPVRVGCFADPFLVALFSPLIILDLLFGDANITSSWEIMFLVAFWGGVWAALAHLYSNIFARTVRKLEPNNSN